MTPARRSGGRASGSSSSGGPRSGQGKSSAKRPAKGPASGGTKRSFKGPAKSAVNPSDRAGGKASSKAASRAGTQAPPKTAAKSPAKKRAVVDDGLSRGGGTVAARNEGPMRVQRALARAGVVSRREADKAVAEGRVFVNGAVATVGQSVDPARDQITLDGAPVVTKVQLHRWIVLHKPAAVMTTRKDPQQRKTVFDLVDDVPGLVYVGRLDFMTEGVLLLTTDGAAAHALTHPSREVERTYIATVRGDAVEAARQARRGVELEDGLVVPRDVEARPLGNRRWAFELTIAEGRTHEVRRLCDALGLEVEQLVRTRFGPVRLGALPSGGARALTRTERDILEALIASS
ncbi:MAG: pseudouridine synthase [Gemmatimonadaceae bacterium]|nr:pseudouridine synthase [Gemmatimonadaceae bacterium]